MFEGHWPVFWYNDLQTGFVQCFLLLIFVCYIFAKNTLVGVSSQRVRDAHGPLLVSDHVDLNHLAQVVLVGFSTLRLLFFLCN